MQTVNERIAKLEEQALEFRAKFRVAGAFSIFVLQAALDQMVDEQILPAATRTEIWGRIRKEISTFQVGSVEIADGAAAAVPRTPSKGEREVMQREHREFQERVERARREILSPIPKKDDAGPTGD